MLIKRTGFLLPFIILACLIVLVWAGTTGKIQGNVTDGETGKSIIGANVNVLNQPYGAATDLDGNYFILNLPPGLYSLQITAIGYDTLTVKDVPVYSDRTTEQNFRMSTKAIRGEKVVVFDVRPIEQDVTATETKLTAEAIESQPVESISQILNTKAGIVTRDGETHLRGGRGGEVSYLVDGMPVNDPISGAQAIEPSTASVQEVSVKTGSYEAEYGNALSGIITYITKEGDPNKFSGSLAYKMDHLMGKYSNNLDRLDISLSGPEPISTKLLPLLGLEMPRSKRISYFFSVTGENTETSLPYNKVFDIESHDPTNEDISTPYKIDYGWYGFFPERRYNNYSLTLKLKQQLSPSFKYIVSFGGGWTRSRIWDWTFYYTPMTAHIYDRQSTQVNLAITHSLSPRTFYEFKVGNFFTKLSYEPGGQTPDDFDVDTTEYNRLDDWVDLNGDGIPQVRVQWWDTNRNGVWDWNEYWRPMVERIDTYHVSTTGSDSIRYDTIYVDGRPPQPGEEPWYDANYNNTFEPRQTNFNSPITYYPTDRAESFMDGEPFLDGIPYAYNSTDPSADFFQAGIIIDTFWNDYNGNGIVDINEYVLNPQYRWDEDYTVEWATYWQGWQSVYGGVFGGRLPSSGADYNDVDHDDYFDYPNMFCDYLDLNGNGIYDYIDVNGNGEWDPGVDYMEPGEPFLDLNDNGIYDGPNGIRDEWEPFVDSNRNGQHDETDGFVDRGYDRWAHWQNRSSNTWFVKGDIASQVNENNYFKTGFEFRWVQMDMQMIQYPEFRYDGVPDNNDYPEHGIFRSFYERTPKNLSLYLQDKMEYGGFIANIGLRADLFFQAGEVKVDSVESLLTYNMEEWWDEEQVVENRIKLSPRLGMSYPITNRAKLFFSYGHFYQLPSYDLFYQMPTQASRAGRLLGNPNLDYEKTVSYEIGIAYAPTMDITFQLSGYFKDIYDLINTSTASLGPVQQSVYKNLDYARSRGLEFTIDKHYSKFWSASMDYQFAFANGKSSSDRSGYDAIFDQTAIPLRDLPLDWDRRHKLSLLLDYRVREGDHPKVLGLKLPDKWGWNWVFQYGSGFPYTPSARNPNYTVRPGEKDWERTNALRMPDAYSLDTRFNKDFSFKGFKYSFVIQMDNVTNRRNVQYVYSDTGLPDIAYFVEDPDTGEIEYIERDVDKDPSRWSAGRNIKVALELKW
ncbi:TonB-dependent receptor [bacterium]|nr:TonB-dependent receptor [bacterium]